MSDMTGGRLSAWGYRVAFVIIALTLWLSHLLPISPDPLPPLEPDFITRPHSYLWPQPNILLCIILAWMFRRPDYLPAWLLAGVVLMEDFLLLRPPGLWAACLLITAEFLRSRTTLVREMSFLTEWALAASLMLLSLLGYHAILFITLAPTPSLALELGQGLWSALVYPLIVWISSAILGIRKPHPGTLEHYGKRL